MVSKGQNSPVEIHPTVTGTGDGQTSSGIISFNPRTQFNRAGLALSQGKVYIAFAAHCDNNPSHGWIISYDASSLAFDHAFISTPNDGRGGIWMSGTAPAIDENGNLYFTTGNNLVEDPSAKNINRIHIFPAAIPSDPANRGEGAIKLAPDLSLASYFTPWNYIALNDGDADFPIQVMLLPNTNLAMTGCKDGNLYIMDRTNLGGFDLHNNLNLQTIPNGGTMHASFAYFGGTTPYAYQFSEGTQLSAYPVTPGGLLTGSAKIKNSVIIGPSGASGGYLSVSSNGTDPNTGILWAYHAQNGCNANNSNCHGILHAVNASDVTKELWNSDMVAIDQVNIFNKFTCPTIALGKVFIAANKNQLFCYGLKTNTTCVTNIALGKAVTASGGSGASNVVDADLATSWTAAAQDANTIFIDLGTDYDICRVALNWKSGAYAKDFNLKVSEDGTHWTVFKTVVGNKLNYIEFNSVVTTRYIEMEGVTRNAGITYAINEFQVYGSLASDCRAPSGLTAVTRKSNTERITWDAVSGADSYTVKYHNYLSPEWLSRTVNTNTIDLTALTCGNLYYYTVQANCSADPSEIGSGAFSPRGCPQNNCDIFPVRYYSMDLGDIGMAGSTCKNGNIYTMSGSGTDIGGISDQFHFTFTNNDNADYETTGQLIQQDQVFPSNKLGIMVRDSLTSTSRFAFMASVNNGANFIFEYRDVAGGPVTTGTYPALYQNPWMKVVKTGTNYTGYISPDDVNWAQIGTSVDLHFGNDPANIPNYGMAVTSADNSGLSSGRNSSLSAFG